jgi:hypothetical protein
MKVLYAFFLFLILNAPIFGQNLIKNPGFEISTFNWNKSKAVDLEISDERQNQGSNSLHISAMTTQNWTTQTADFIPVKSGEVYELQSFVSVEKLNQQTDMSLVFFDYSEKEISTTTKRALFITGEDNWQVFVSEFIVPEMVSFAKIQISGRDSSEVYLDDLALKKSTLINKKGDFSIENSRMKATLYLPTYEVRIFDKQTQEIYKTLPVEGFITENIVVGASDLKLKSFFLTENMQIEFTLKLEENVLKIEIDPSDAAAPMFNDLEFPGAIPSKKGQRMVVPEYKKLFIPVEQPYPTYRLDMKDPQHTVSMVGVQGDKSAYFISTENASDAGFSFPENKDSLHEPQLWLSADHGLWGQKRTLYIGVTKDDYADITAWYTTFATARGWKLPPHLGLEKKQYIVKILPNPTSDVNFDAPLSEKTVLLIQDVNGKNLLTEVLESGSDSYRFEIENFSAGLYQLYLFYPSGHHQAMRFVKN